MLNKTFSNLMDGLRLLFRKDKESYLCFYRMLGFYPHDIRFYEQALLHKSFSVKLEQGGLLNNERLEFLGDAILDAVVADIVYQNFEGKREGFLTNTRSKIVSRESLNHVAEQIGLSKLIKYSIWLYLEKEKSTLCVPKDMQNTLSVVIKNLLNSKVSNLMKL